MIIDIFSKIKVAKFFHLNKSIKLRTLVVIRIKTKERIKIIIKLIYEQTS